MKKNLFQVFILVLTFCYFKLFGEPVNWNEVCYDDETVSQLITVVISTNPIPSIPKVKHLYSCQKSLFLIPALRKCRKIIVFDGIQPKYGDRAEDYHLYKINVKKLTKRDPFFANTKLVFCKKWVHLSGAIRLALKYVKTPYIFIQQHDFDIIKPFDLNAVIATLAANPAIQHVKFDYSPRNDCNFWWNGPVDEVVGGVHFVPLTRTFGWSDVTHVCRTSYYLDFVLPQCFHGPMEAFLQSSFQRDIEKLGYKKAHKKYGTYLYGKIEDGKFIQHTDGRFSPP